LLRERIGFLAQRDPRRRARKLEELSQRVNEIAKAGLQHASGAQAEQHNIRRLRLGAWRANRRGRPIIACDG
jgi:hypothetical protein